MSASQGQAEVYEDVGDPEPLHQPFPPAADIEKDAIDEDGVTPDQAFEVFAGKKFHTRKGRGMVSHQREYHLAAGGEARHEAPLERFHRLVAEVDQFMSELELAKKQASDDKDSNAVDSAIRPDDLSRELSVLKAQLTSVLDADGNPTPILSAFEQTTASTGADASSQRLITQLDALTATDGGKAASRGGEGSSGGGGGGGGTSGEGGVRYELYLGGGVGSKTVALPELESRVAALEALVGRQAGVEEGDSATPLADKVCELESRFALLDGPRLDQLARKAATATVHIDALIKQADSLPESRERDEKIAELYKVTQQWGPGMQQLPVVVSRLRSLKQLHNAASGVTGTLTRVQGEQAQLQTLLQGNDESIKTMQSSLAENMTAIKGNVTSLEERISKLKK